MQTSSSAKKICFFSCIAVLVIIVVIICYPHVRHRYLISHGAASKLGAGRMVNGMVNRFQTLKEFQDYTYSRAASGNQSVSEQTDNSFNIYIEDILISIKTTKKFHEPRLKILLDTWIPQAKQSTYILTDAVDSKYSQLVGADRFVNTACPASHSRQDLACKFQATYNLMISKIEKYKWFCAGDDDTYIVLPNLVKALRQYDCNQRWYIGKNSLPYKATGYTYGQSFQYWFATGGALVCFSNGMVQRMLPLCGSGGFIDRADELSQPDDTTIGYVCNYLLGVNLTVIPEFHSHLEPLYQLNPTDYHKQVSLSWRNPDERYPNTLLIRDEIPKFSKEQDPSRLLSVHCYLYPKSDECRKIKAQL